MLKINWILVIVNFVVNFTGQRAAEWFRVYSFKRPLLKG